ncbi:MAG TPA: hypothetical protein VG709_04655 [Actinomycetota bacterium]|nr:hypothetical protein [Actinomycetota bacterium]
MANGAIEEQGELVWEGALGQTRLRIDILPSGRLTARWRSHGNERRVVVDTEQELERRVLFGLMVGGGGDEQGVAREIMGKVVEAKSSRPDPTQAVRRKKKRTRPSRRGIPRPRRR